MSAVFVCDGGQFPKVPDEMGTARFDQMQGTPAEQLVEIAGRVCYDSLGKGRNSAEYHKHLVEVKHYSVHEHPHFTVMFENAVNFAHFMSLINVADCTARIDNVGIRVTFNLRHALDWNSYAGVYMAETGIRKDVPHEIMGLHAAFHANNIASNIVEIPRLGIHLPVVTATRVVEPQYENEKFITMFLRGSRVFSHEMVRHRNNMSQRSGRYCDESETPLLDHPLFVHMCKELKYDLDDSIALHGIRVHSKSAYNQVVIGLQEWLERKGANALDARKQARSAGRFYLGNGLETEMVYTASVERWKHIFRMRCNPAADAEIRAIMCETLREIKANSMHGSLFSNFILAPIENGLGEALVEMK